MRSIVLTIVLGLATTAFADADDMPYSDAFNVCREAAQTTRQTTDCIDREHERWDESLNTEYRTFLDALDEDSAEALREAQRAWIAWRDLECAFAASRYEGGTFAPVAASFCLLDETIRRAEALKKNQEE